eukprot:scaffold129408_cov30-Tisochrysis_lutea.AAC.1
MIGRAARGRKNRLAMPTSDRLGCLSLRIGKHEEGRSLPAGERDIAPIPHTHVRLLSAVVNPRVLDVWAEGEDGEEAVRECAAVWRGEAHQFSCCFDERWIAFAVGGEGLEREERRGERHGETGVVSKAAREKSTGRADGDVELELRAPTREREQGGVPHVGEVEQEERERQRASLSCIDTSISI